MLKHLVAAASHPTAYVAEEAAAVAPPGYEYDRFYRRCNPCSMIRDKTADMMMIIVATLSENSIPAHRRPPRHQGLRANGLHHIF